jgi:hypothetical protein
VPGGDKASSARKANDDLVPHGAGAGGVFLMGGYTLFESPGQGPSVGYWGAMEQKTRLRIQATSSVESDGLRSGRNSPR